MFKSKVCVCSDEAGAIIVQTENPDYGYIRLEQTKTNFKKTGWIKKQKLSSLIFGEVDELKELNWQNGMVLPGNIVVLEQLEPFNNDEPSKDYKIAGSTGIICCLDGQPIYRRSYYEPNEDINDTLIEHDNGEVISEAFKLELEELSNSQAIDDLNPNPKTSKSKKKVEKVSEDIDLSES